MGQILAMSSTDTVGVVIPTFNSESTIERALKSVSEQSVLPNEVVVVDNASTDGTVVAVKRFAQTTPQLNLSLIELETNTGPGNARNIGWNKCQTSLIAFLDSDDSWHPNKLEIQLQIIQRHPNHLLFGHRYVVIDSGETATVAPMNGSGELSYFTLHDFLIRNRISTPTAIVRRDIPHRFPDNQWFAEDFALWTSILAAGGQAVVTETVFTYLYKAAYGQSGLSAKLREMHQGELRVLHSLSQSGAISKLHFAGISAWMRLKYLRRLIRGASV